MSEINATPRVNRAPRGPRNENFEPELTAAELAEQNLEPYVFRGITFYREREVICPACAAGHHEQPALHPCDCACHMAAKPAAIDYERLGYELALSPLELKEAA